MIKAQSEKLLPPVDVRTVDGKAYVYLHLNPMQVEVDGVTVYEYDYHEFSGSDLPLDDITANPDKYLDYTPPKPLTTEDRLAKLEALVMGLI